jgi:Co/Zn/Cd efflux system component
MVAVKLWLYFFNIRLSKFIDSASLKATGIDSRNDAISTAVVLLSLLLDKLTGVHIDGWVGLAVGVFIIYSGLSMVKETAAPLLGQKADPVLVRKIAELVLAQPGALGLHDLIVHDYGPGHIFASVHVEVDARVDIFESHFMVDKLEQLAKQRLGVLLVGHMDPVDTQDVKLRELKALLTDVLSDIDGAISMHDLRLIPGPGRTNVIFDVVIAHEEESEAIVRARVQDALNAYDPIYVADIQFDLEYAAENNAN